MGARERDDKACVSPVYRLRKPLVGRIPEKRMSPFCSPTVFRPASRSRKVDLPAQCADCQPDCFTSLMLS